MVDRGWSIAKTAVGALFCGSLAIVVVAAEPAAEAGLAQAKKDYEALKSTRAPASNPGVSTSAMAAIPELKTDSPMLPEVPARPATAGATERELAKARAKSHNWLLETMAESAKTDRGLSGGRRDRESARPSAQRDPLLGVPETTSSGTSLENADEPLEISRESLSERPAPVMEMLNPLDRYMADWMTPGDFRLLATNPDPTKPAGQLGVGPSAQPERSMDGSRITLFEPTGASTPEPSINPYLAGGDSGLASFRTVDLSPPAQPAPPSPPAPMLVLPSPTPPPPIAPLSEQFRMQADAKYFKQLKRF